MISHTILEIIKKLKITIFFTISSLRKNPDPGSRSKSKTPDFHFEDPDPYQ